MKKVTIILAMLALMLSTNIFAQDDYENNEWISHSDVKGSKDSPLISRFKGSIIQYYKVEKWNKYIIPVSKIENTENGAKDWKKKLKIAGEVRRIQYSVSKDNNPALVAENYNNALKSSDWEILFSGCGDDELGNDSYEWCYYYYGSDGLNLEKFGSAFNPNGKAHCYIAAKQENTDSTYYVAIYVSDKVDDSKGLHFTLITQDIIKVKNPDLGLVTAKILADKINSKGHIAIYDIHFDTGKSSIKPESTETLKNIAEYLNAHQNEKFLIVGHTDNTGNFDANLKLSSERAQTVMNALVSKYSVKAEQLKAYGDGQTAPVATNLTDEGKAKNRRVEIVKL